MKPTSYWLDTAQPFNRGSSNPPRAATTWPWWVAA